MKLFGKKKKESPSVEQMKTKTKVAAVKADRRVAAAESEMAKARAEAKEALKRGDERTAKRALKKHAMYEQKIKVFTAVGDAADTTEMNIETQEATLEAAEMGRELKELQEEIDQEKIVEGLTDLREATEQAQSQTDALIGTVESISANEETEGIADELKAELMAEIDSETDADDADVKELEKKLKKERA